MVELKKNTEILFLIFLFPKIQILSNMGAGSLLSFYLTILYTAYEQGQPLV